MPTQKPDPWEAAAAAYKQGSESPTSAGQPANDDWKVWQAQDEQPQPMMTQMAQGAKNLGIGAAKGLLHTVSGADDWARQHLPAFMTNSDFGFGPPANLQHVHQMATPEGTAQKIGYGGEQAGEFLIPGGAEEGLAEKAAEFAPKLKPLARIAAGALSAGAVNKAQGGSFKGGMAAGAAGGAVGEGLKAVAPGIAESALKIRKLDRAYGKTPGEAILNETRGVRPGTVAESAQSRLDELNPKLNEAADRASVRPNQARRLLPAPTQEIPLGEAPQPPDMPGGLYDAQHFPPQNVGEARVIRNARGQILPKAARNVEFPDESGKLPFGRNPKGQILSRTPTRQAWMTGINGEVPETPSFSGPGVLLRRPEVPIGAAPIPESVPARMASLSPARGVLSAASGRAARQGERTTMSQLDPMFTHLSEDVAGNPIGSDVTPRQLLDLKRGFGNEFIHRWNPETMNGVKGTAAQTYHAMSNEFNRVVPEAKELNGRISSLIPVAKRAASTDLNAETGQRILGRVAAHTGAATLGGLGAVQGYRENGAKGAILGGLGGIAIPELVASPTAQMAVARTLHSPTSKILPKLLVGGALQNNR